jgi:hypothetical protein
MAVAVHDPSQMKSKTNTSKKALTTADKQQLESLNKENNINDDNNIDSVSCSEKRQ